MTITDTSKPRRPRRDGSRADTADVTPTPTGPVDAASTPARQRIAKAMARAGLCSRREAETWIVAGRVSVNGELLSSPARDVGPDDAVLVDGQPLPAPEKTRLFLFHKPRGLITSDHDPDGRETVADFLRENWPEGPRVVTVGRLDINTEGLLLLTNDGGLARTLELPETGWLRRYRVRAKGQTDQAALDALADGIEVDGISYAGIEAKLDRIQGSNCWLTMGLREGKNREIKRVLEHLGLEVNRLIRVSFGPFQLLDLPDGAVEEVRTRILRDQLGGALGATAGVDFGEVGAVATHAGGRAEPATQQGRDAPEPVRERHERASGPRRHVSALRTAKAPGDEGRRTRIERTATKDRRDRTVAVERLVSREPPVRVDGRKRVSPSAEAKRVRVSRSGGPGVRDDGARRHRDGRERPDRAERSRSDRPGSAGGGSERRGNDRPKGDRPHGARPAVGAAGRSRFDRPGPDDRPPRRDNGQDRAPWRREAPDAPASRRSDSQTDAGASFKRADQARGDRSGQPRGEGPSRARTDRQSQPRGDRPTQAREARSGDPSGGTRGGPAKRGAGARPPRSGARFGKPPGGRPPHKGGKGAGGPPKPKR